MTVNGLNRLYYLDSKCLKCKCFCSSSYENLRGSKTGFIYITACADE